MATAAPAARRVIEAFMVREVVGWRRYWARICIECEVVRRAVKLSVGPQVGSE
jgi:hypothetical protein